MDRATFEAAHPQLLAPVLQLVHRVIASVGALSVSFHADWKPFATVVRRPILLKNSKMQ